MRESEEARLYRAGQRARLGESRKGHPAAQVVVFGVFL